MVIFDRRFNNWISKLQEPKKLESFVGEERYGGVVFVENGNRSLNRT